MWQWWMHKDCLDLDYGGACGLNRPATAVAEPGSRNRGSMAGMPPRLLALLLATTLVPSFADAQALPNITLARVRYNTLKVTANPQGELKLQIDAVDRAIAEASQAGNAAEVRRQMAKGLTLLAGREWTPALDFQNSLALRSEHTVVDSSTPYTLRLEQIYRPSIDLTPGAVGGDASEAARGESGRRTGDAANLPTRARAGGVRRREPRLAGIAIRDGRGRDRRARRGLCD